MGGPDSRSINRGEPCSRGNKVKPGSRGNKVKPDSRDITIETGFAGYQYNNRIRGISIEPDSLGIKIGAGFAGYQYKYRIRGISIWNRIRGVSNGTGFTGYQDRTGFAGYQLRKPDTRDIKAARRWEYTYHCIYKNRVELWCAHHTPVLCGCRRLVVSQEHWYQAHPTVVSIENNI